MTVVVPVKPLPRRRGFTTDDDSWTPTDEPSDRYQPSITFELTGRSHFPITVRFVHSTPHDVYLPPSFSEYAVSKPTVDHTLIKAGVPPIVLDGGKFWVSRESIGVFAHGDWAYKVYALDGKWDAAHRSWEAAQTMGLPMLKSAWETSGWSLRTGGKTKAVVFFKARLVEGKKFFALSQNTAHVWGQFVKEQKTVGPLGECVSISCLPRRELALTTTHFRRLLEGMCLAHAVGLSDAQVRFNLSLRSPTELFLHRDSSDPVYPRNVVPTSSHSWTSTPPPVVPTPTSPLPSKLSSTVSAPSIPSGRTRSEQRRRGSSSVPSPEDCLEM